MVGGLSGCAGVCPDRGRPSPFGRLGRRVCGSLVRGRAECVRHQCRWHARRLGLGSRVRDRAAPVARIEGAPELPEARRIEARPRTPRRGGGSRVVPSGGHASGPSYAGSAAGRAARSAAVGREPMGESAAATGAGSRGASAPVGRRAHGPRHGRVPGARPGSGIGRVGRRSSGAACKGRPAAECRGGARARAGRAGNGSASPCWPGVACVYLACRVPRGPGSAHPPAPARAGAAREPGASTPRATGPGAASRAPASGWTRASPPAVQGGDRPR